MCRLGNEGAGGIFGVFASVYAGDRVALALEVKADGVEGLGAVVGNLGFKVLFDVGVDLFAVVARIVGEGDIDKHIRLLVVICLFGGMVTQKRWFVNKEMGEFLIG